MNVKYKLIEQVPVYYEHSTSRCNHFGAKRGEAKV